MSHEYGQIEVLGVLAFAITAGLVDLRTRRIPNVLTVPAALCGVTLNVLATGLSGFLQSGAGLLAGLVVFLPFYLARGFGAGDIKAMSAVGAFVGPAGVLICAAWTLLAGALGGLAVLAMHGGLGRLREFVMRLVMRTGLVCATGMQPRSLPGAAPAPQKFPYGLAIACGVLAFVVRS